MGHTELLKLLPVVIFSTYLSVLVLLLLAILS